MHKALCLLFLIFADRLVLHGQLKYTSDGNAYELEFIKRGSLDTVQHLILFHKDGSKKEESFFKGKRYVDTLRKWDVQGKLWYMRAYRDSSYFEKEYFDKDCWQEGWYREVATIPRIQVIDDSSTWTRYTVAAYERKPYYVRTGAWRVFHKSGVMISQGNFLPESYEASHPGRNVVKKGFESEDWYFLGGAKFSGFYAGDVGYLKDGEWIYYNEIGYEIYREVYRNGLLVKMQ